MDNVYENITDIFSSDNFNGKIGKIKGNDKLFTNFLYKWSNIVICDNHLFKETLRQI